MSASSSKRDASSCSSLEGVKERGGGVGREGEREGEDEIQLILFSFSCLDY